MKEVLPLVCMVNQKMGSSVDGVSTPHTDSLLGLPPLVCMVMFGRTLGIINFSISSHYWADPDQESKSRLSTELHQ